jgi:alpha-amylase/alpha-mannosidase (GH57 family)
MKSINLIFGCHSHQPVGNFENVFAMAYDQAYLPFVEVLEKYPAVKVTHHFTGPLFDWFEANRPEFIERLAALVQATNRCCAPCPSVTASRRYGG